MKTKAEEVLDKKVNEDGLTISLIEKKYSDGISEFIIKNESDAVIIEAVRSKTKAKRIFNFWSK